jgi:hemoglobin-like flavoprotein
VFIDHIVVITDEQIELVQSSYKQIAPDADRVAETFYARLFELDPSLRPMFKDDMAEQRQKLMQMMTVAVDGLDRLDLIIPTAQALGRRHVDYGVKESHYETVGAALLWTLEKLLGDAFTAELRSAWMAAYGLIASTAIEALPLSERDITARRR